MNMVKRNSEIKPFYSNFLDDFLNTGLSAFEDRRGVPALNVKEDEKELALELRVPGMKKEDFQIHINEDNDLVISMEKKTESTEGDKGGKEESRYLRREFSYSKFQQTLILPDDVDKDKIDAKVNDGVLTIELPKRTPEEKEKATKVIEVK